MKKMFRLVLFFSVWSVLPVGAQRILTENDQDVDELWRRERDSVETVNVPVGYKVWRIGEQFGDIRQAEPDTLQYMFMNDAFTSGRTGHYNHTGNLGAPRLNRIFMERNSTYDNANFLFARPYDFFLTGPDALLFTNTKSPFTNLTYHSGGGKVNGDDHFKALFATNVNKQTGVGFKIDYLYGRGYYANQANSQFNFTIYGSHLGEKYQLHTMYYANHVKNAENGGLENDAYVTNPESFATSYSTNDMPTNLSRTWSKMHVNTFYLTHRYSFGFRRYYDDKGNLVRSRTQQEGGGKFLRNILSASANDSLGAGREDSIAPLKLRPEFVPVASVIHTLRIDKNNRQFLSNLAKDNFFKDYYLPGDSANDKTDYLRIKNVFALELREGFNKWVKSSLRLFAQHEWERYTLPNLNRMREAYNENHISLGAQLAKEQGRIFHYRVRGEMRTSGSDWGEFNVEGTADFKLPLKRDSLSLHLFGHVKNELPSFYFRHYHARNAWWDNENLNKQFSTRVGGELSYKALKAKVVVENIKNHTYFQEQKTVNTTAEGKYLYAVNVQQHTPNIQIVSAALSHELKLGIFNWNNELTYQLSSEKAVLPLPALNIYSNLFIRFRIAKVLATDFGVDARFFTKYDAPAYSPMIGQFAVQDNASKVSIGNYPMVNVYANFHLKQTRFYIMASHANFSKGTGHPFLVPRHPLNRMVIRFGISWNFYN